MAIACRIGERSSSAPLIAAATGLKSGAFRVGAALVVFAPGPLADDVVDESVDDASKASSRSTTRPLPSKKRSPGSPFRPINLWRR